MEYKSEAGSSYSQAYTFTVFYNCFNLEYETEVPIISMQVAATPQTHLVPR